MTEKNINAALADRVERVSRQTLLPEIGEAGRDRIFGSVVTVIGAGGLGSPLVLYLAAAGVGEIRLIDLDTVSVSNLSRQVLHTTAEVGEPKVESAARTIARMTPHTRIVPVDAEATQGNLVRLLEGADLLIDASDNLATRITASRASLATKVPLLFGSAIRWTGQVGLFNPKKPGAPLFRVPFRGGRGRQRRQGLPRRGRLRHDGHRRDDHGQRGREVPRRCPRRARGPFAHGRRALDGLQDDPSRPQPGMPFGGAPRGLRGASGRVTRCG